MQNAQHRGFKKESHATNQFNDPEYKRWSEAITGSESPRTEGGIESFLGMNENPRSSSQDPSMSLVEIGSRSCSLCGASHELGTNVSEQQRMSRDGSGDEQRHQAAAALEQYKDPQA
jgi:hypothetical protein